MSEVNKADINKDFKIFAVCMQRIVTDSEQVIAGVPVLREFDLERTGSPADKRIILKRNLTLSAKPVLVSQLSEQS